MAVLSQHAVTFQSYSKHQADRSKRKSEKEEENQYGWFLSGSQCIFLHNTTALCLAAKTPYTVLCYPNVILKHSRNTSLHWISCTTGLEFKWCLACRKESPCRSVTAEEASAKATQGYPRGSQAGVTGGLSGPLLPLPDWFMDFSSISSATVPNTDFSSWRQRLRCDLPYKLHREFWHLFFFISPWRQFVPNENVL